MARFGQDFQINKKGTIDLVTEVDVAVERRFRALVAERFPDHQILAEEMGGAAAVPAARAGSSIRSTARPISAHGLPIFLRVARARDRRRARSGRGLRPDPQGAVHGRARRRRVHERPPAARIVGDRAHRRDAGHRVPLRRSYARRGDRRAVRRVRRPGARRAAPRSAAIDLCYVAAGRLDGFWETDLKPWDIAGGALIVSEAGGA